MINFSIQKIDADKIELLQAISQQTFIETFESTNSKENMDRYLSEALSIETLQREMDDDEASFYFGYDNSKLIGYLKLNFGNAQTELKDKDGLEIERIYIIKEYLGKGAGQFLLNEAVNIAHLNSAKYLWLGVWEHNERAINFYKKNGFVQFDEHDFVLGDDIQTDIMMRLEIESKLQ